MLRYMTDRARSGLVALYNIRPGNGAGQFLQPRSPHGAENTVLNVHTHTQLISDQPIFSWSPWLCQVPTCFLGKAGLWERDFFNRVSSYQSWIQKKQYHITDKTQYSLHLTVSNGRDYKTKTMKPCHSIFNWYGILEFNVPLDTV